MFLRDLGVHHFEIGVKPIQRTQKWGGGGGGGGGPYRFSYRIYWDGRGRKN